VPEEDAEAARKNDVRKSPASVEDIEYHGTAATTKDMQSIRAN